MLNLSPTEWLVVRSVYIILAIVGAIGSLSNFSLFLVTIRTKSLRSTCHLLIGLCALLDGCHQIGTLFQFPLLFSDGEIDSLTCSSLLLLPEIGVLGGCACVLSIGLERLIALVFVARYKSFGHRHLVAHLLLISFFGHYAVYLMVAYFQQTRQICAIQAPFHGDAAPLWSRCFVALNMTTVTVYATVAMIISKKAEVSAETRKSFRSIFFVMTSDVSGWAIAIGILKATVVIEMTAETRFITLYVSGLVVNTGIAVKALIYYSTSSEYRQAFRDTFCKNS
ncbi:hypothetical protein PENTCL1PPCAC_16906, partial [Pristionchus entomophagus]